MAQLARGYGDRELTLQSLPWRVAELLDLGHVQAADEAIAHGAQVAPELRQPLYPWYISVFRALRVLMQGQFDAGERLVQGGPYTGATSVSFCLRLWLARSRRQEYDRQASEHNALQKGLESA